MFCGSWKMSLPHLPAAMSRLLCIVALTREGCELAAEWKEEMKFMHWELENFLRLNVRGECRWLVLYFPFRLSCFLSIALHRMSIFLA